MTKLQYIAIVTVVLLVEWLWYEIGKSDLEAYDICIKQEGVSEETCQYYIYK